jgi:hypothetical protein
MIFETPALLLALMLLPVLWWLLRATPPAPRAQRFPAIRLLASVRPKEETPARTPWWLLLLRLAAACLIILGLAGPVLNAGRAALPAKGPALLVIDDGFAAGPDFARRLDAAQAVLDRLERAGRHVSLLTTAPGFAGRAPSAGPVMPAAVLRPEVQALRPKPWPVDRAAAGRAVHGSGPVFYISDGLAASGDAAFASALVARGPVAEFIGSLPVRLLSAVISPDRLTARLLQSPGAAQRVDSVLAEANDGRVFARIPLPVPAGAREARVDLPLPPELRNQLGALRLSGVSGAGSVALLDEAARRRPVGLVSLGGSGETPLLGDLFFIDRALAPTTELRHGDVKTLLSRQLSMLVIAGGGLLAEDASRVEAFVRKGGLLLRFAGPDLAQESASPGEPDPLLPERLLAGDRQLGGAMSWSQAAHVAAFGADSPFNGLRVPAEVTVNREVLADPSDASPAHVWARLTDGTPLVTVSRLGAGEVVLFHVTANADWSNLPLSGLFVDMLGRLVERSVGVAASDDARMLSPVLALDGEGVLGTPPPAAQSMTVAEMAKDVPSPLHPPGFYGPERDRHAFNLGASAIALEPMGPVPGAAQFTLAATPRERKLGPDFVGLALLMLALDMAVTLRLRGLLDRLARPAAAAALALTLLAASEAGAQSPALATHLAYVVTGDAEVDGVSRSGLAGLSDYVNSRTAAVLADPLPVVPGKDDLSFYPFLYFPVTADAGASPAAVAALNDYMRHGGIIVFDLRGGDAESGGSGAGFAPDSGNALQRLGKGLDIPKLSPLTSTHVLAHAFYLLSDFPGRFDGDTVWVQQAQDRSNDSVSPVVVGSNDWAAAWAEDEDGKPQYAVIPGGQRQRTLAFRFGVNLVMYALTGNYKGDQVHVPAILERLGQ